MQRANLNHSIQAVCTFYYSVPGLLWVMGPLEIIVFEVSTFCMWFELCSFNPPTALVAASFGHLYPDFYVHGPKNSSISCFRCSFSTQLIVHVTLDFLYELCVEFI